VALALGRDHEGDAPGVLPHLLRPELAAGPVGEVRVGKEPPRVGTGGVQDRPPRPLDEAGLGPEVALHVAVEVEVLRREVGPDREVVVHVGHPVLGEGVGAGLEHHVGHPRRPHLGEHPLELGGLGGGEVALGVDEATAVGVAHRAQKPRPQAERVEEVVNHVARRRLAVGAGDPHDEELAGGLAEEGRGQARKRPSAVRHPGVGDGDRKVPLPHHRHRPPRQGLGDKGVAVVATAGERDVDEAGPDLARIMGHPGDG